MTPRFSMRGIRKAFAGTVAVNGIDLEVFPGEVCALVGQNGAGKSTLMSILAGALRPDAGEMTMDGAPYRPKSPLEARRAGVTMIYQELSLAPHLSVMENISLGNEPVAFGFVSRRELRTRAIGALAELGHPDIDPEADAESLSVAEQQIVEIARALVSGSRVLVLDEPTSTLGGEDVERLFSLIARLKAQQHAIVYISHFIEEVTRISDRVVVLRDGEVAGSSATRDIAAAEIVRLMVGQSVDDLYRRSNRLPGEPVLQIDPLLPGSNPLVLHRGEIVGIAGLVGAGRTRLLRTVFGLEPGPYSASPRERWKQRIGMLSEDRKGEGLATNLSVADNITLSRLEQLGVGPLVIPSRQAAAVLPWMDRLQVRAQGPRQPVEDLSGGNQQKVAFARLLHHGVDIMLLDEPTRGIDVGSKAQIYALLDQWAAEQKSVLIVSSYLPELLGVCDRIAVMRRGRLGPARPVHEWNEHALMMTATGAEQ